MGRRGRIDADWLEGVVEIEQAKKQGDVDNQSLYFRIFFEMRPDSHYDTPAMVIIKQITVG